MKWCACIKTKKDIACAQAISFFESSFFGYIQRLYTLFAAFVARWKLCKPRWESWIECIKSDRFLIIDIHDTLIIYYENSTDAATKHEYLTLTEKFVSILS